MIRGLLPSYLFEAKPTLNSLPIPSWTQSILPQFVPYSKLNLQPILGKFPTKFECIYNPSSRTAKQVGVPMIVPLLYSPGDGIFATLNFPGEEAFAILHLLCEGFPTILQLWTRELWYAVCGSACLPFMLRGNLWENPAAPLIPSQIYSRFSPNLKPNPQPIL